MLLTFPRYISEDMTSVSTVAAYSLELHLNQSQKSRVISRISSKIRNRNFNVKCHASSLQSSKLVTAELNHHHRKVLISSVTISKLIFIAGLQWESISSQSTRSTKSGFVNPEKVQRHPDE